MAKAEILAEALIHEYAKALFTNGKIHILWSPTSLIFLRRNKATGVLNEIGRFNFNSFAIESAYGIRSMLVLTDRRKVYEFTINRDEVNLLAVSKVNGIRPFECTRVNTNSYPIITCVKGNEVVIITSGLLVETIPLETELYGYASACIRSKCLLVADDRDLYVIDKETGRIVKKYEGVDPNLAHGSAVWTGITRNKFFIPSNDKFIIIESDGKCDTINYQEVEIPRDIFGDDLGYPAIPEAVGEDWVAVFYRDGIIVFDSENKMADWLAGSSASTDGTYILTADPWEYSDVKLYKLFSSDEDNSN